MVKASFVAIVFSAALLVAPLRQGRDLSRYREFQFGMGLPAVAKLARAKTSEAKVVHQRPAMIQELAWDAISFTHSSPQTESVSNIVFSFYNGELFRMVVNYDRDRTEGMTDKDIIEAISAKYGTASVPTAEITLYSTQVYSDGEKHHSNQNEKVIARWEDSEYCFDLFRSSLKSSFGLVVYSKRLDALAGKVITESIRLDEHEAPQRELARQKLKLEADRIQLEKARRTNKAPFRP